MVINMIKKCGKCGNTTESKEYIPQFCGNCGNKFPPAKVRKTSNPNISCFECKDGHICKIGVEYSNKHVCENFIRAEWSRELIEELMSMPRA